MFLFIGYSSIAQSILKGRISDPKGRPAEFTSVLLLKSTDSTLIKSALTNEQGNYIFNSINYGTYLICASIVGQPKNYQTIHVSTNEVSVPEIKLLGSPSQIREVTVIARKPFLEQRPDKLVVNVEASATAAGSTAMEVLQKVPGIIITNDKVTMVGKGSPAIYIDGRPSQYTDISQLLRDMSAANIDRIEVISNPGAKYDAAGGAVINIILKRNANLGTNGTLGLSGGYGLYEKGLNRIDKNFYRISPSLNVSHRSGKLALFGNYSVLHREMYEYSEFSRIISPSRFFQSNYSPIEFYSHNYRAGLDLYADKKNTFGFIFRGNNRAGDRNSDNATQQLNQNDDAFVSAFQTINASSFLSNVYSSNVNWKHSFDTLGRDLNIDLDYSSFSTRNNSHITNKLENGTQYVNEQLVKNPVKLTVIKADYAHPLSKNSKLEAGLKASIANIDNYLTYINNGTLDTNRSTDFEYNEGINAAYTSYQQKTGKWNFQGGLRAEQTIAKGKDESGTVLNRNYIQLFPSLFITREMTSKLSAVAQYSRRVNRPGFNQQNPFIEFLDSLTYTQGNPKLKPETSDQYKVSITYENQPFFSLSYNKKHDVIFENAPRQNGNLTYTTAENLASFDNFAAELNFPIKLGKKISGYGGNQFIYNHYKADYLDGQFNRGKWNWLAYWQANYKPTGTLNFEVSGYYMTRFLNEFLIINNLGSLNFAIQKTFWDKKGRISLNINDVLYTDRVKASISYQQIDVDFRQLRESRNARLSFTYSFGNQKLKAERNRKTASEDEANRVKTN